MYIADNTHNLAVVRRINLDAQLGDQVLLLSKAGSVKIGVGVGVGVRSSRKICLLAPERTEANLGLAPRPLLFVLRLHIGVS